jgi:putative endopeptidase
MDFYTLVNYKWLNKTKIPDDKPIWSQFNILTYQNLLKIKELIKNTDNQNIKILYEQGINIRNQGINIRNQGINIRNQDIRNQNKDISFYLNKIDKIQSIEELLNNMFKFQYAFSLNTPLNLDISSDLNNSKINILHISTGGLGLPSRDYYFKENKKEIVTLYKKFMIKYSQLFNLNLNTEKIFMLEELIAEKTYSKTEERDPYLINNPRNYDEILHDYPKLKDLLKYFKLNPDSKINIINPKFVKKICELLEPTLLIIWKDYMKWLLILNVHSYLENNIELCYLDFYDNVLKGKKKIEPAWELSLNNVCNHLNQEIGLMYANQYFKNEVKEYISIMIEYIRNIVLKRLSISDILSESSRNTAIIKLKNMKVKIGKPSDKGLLDYSKLKLSYDNSYLTNNILCIKYNNNINFNKLYKERNVEEWFKGAWEVNAYYSPSLNEIVFPAGILQKPFFDINNSVYENFGGIGMIIGHEIIHGFDDQGRLFDENGNLRMWWTPQDNMKYEEKIKVLAEQYSNYKIEGEYINTQLTQGENIADLGGLTFSLEALTQYLKDHNIKEDNEKYKDFFKSYARIWASKIRPEFLKQKLLIDPHSPPIFRVNGILRNIDKFYQVFNIKEKEKICEIW